MRSFMILIAVAATGSAMAQLNVTSRSSALSYQWLMGYAGDVYQGNDLRNVGTLLSNDVQQFTVAESRTGFYPPTNHSWSASVGMDIRQNYQIDGPLNNAWKISANSRTAVETVQAGATVQAFAANPGNQLTFTFDVAAPTPYAMTYQSFNAASSEFPGEVSLQQWNGFTWTYVHSSLFEAPSILPRTWNGSFSAGTYRAFVFTNANNFDNEVNDARGSFVIETAPVPEPGTMAALGLGMAALLRRRRRVS